MLKLNINTLAKARGIKNLTAHLTNFGFTYQPAFRLASGKIKSLPIRNIEKLCLALNCTPNDLFIFQPQSNEPIPENHPLKPLIPVSQHIDLTNFADEIPISKLHEFSQKLEELKSQIISSQK